MAPKTGLTVCEPAANSGTLVFPTVIAPASRSRSTTSSLSAGTLSANSGEPKVVRIPAVRWVSLWATGRPCSGPSGPPLAWRSSADRAAEASAILASGQAIRSQLTLRALSGG